MAAGNCPYQRNGLERRVYTVFHGRFPRGQQNDGATGSPYHKIVLAGTDRALAATADAKVITVPAFTGTPNRYGASIN